MHTLLNAYSKFAPGHAGFFHLHTAHHMLLIQQNSPMGQPESNAQISSGA